jgi:hypothetical protein
MGIGLYLGSFEYMDIIFTYHSLSYNSACGPVHENRLGSSNVGSWPVASRDANLDNYMETLARTWVQFCFMW